jgi:hypothetical protein
LARVWALGPHLARVLDSNGGVGYMLDGPQHTLEWVCQKCGNLLGGFDECVRERIRASALPLGGELMV